jgi:hypothetical protein
MLCGRCGHRLEALTSFCPRCGTPVLVQSPAQRQTSILPNDDARKSAAWLVFIGCFVLALISATALSGPAEIVALACIAIFCFGWSKRGIAAWCDPWFPVS